MKRNKYNKRIYLIPVLAAMIALAACTEKITFPGSETPEIPKLENATAEYLWVGRDYKLAVAVTVSDGEALTSLQISNGEWSVDTLVAINGTRYVFRDTFPVSKDATPTRHEMELTVKNAAAGILKTSIEVNDLSAVNQIEGYNPDLLPPVIVISQPTTTNFYGLQPDPVNLNVQATVTEDDEIAEIYMKVWGESVTGSYFETDETVTPSTEPEKTAYTYARSLTLQSLHCISYRTGFNLLRVHTCNRSRYITSLLHTVTHYYDFLKGSEVFLQSDVECRLILNRDFQRGVADVRDFQYGIWRHFQRELSIHVGHETY
jgi:hypothetical protein